MIAGIFGYSLDSGASLFFQGLDCLHMLDFTIHAELRTHENNLSRSGFKTNRALTCTPPPTIAKIASNRQCYETAFNSKFIKDLMSLDSSQHWVDLGAGEALAMMEYLMSKNSRACRTTAINYKAPPSYLHHWSDIDSSLTDNHRMLQGEDFLEMSSAEIGSADIITDVFGVMSYTPEFDKALAKTLSLLKPNGRFYMVLTTSSFESIPTNGYFDIARFLEMVTGIDFDLVNHNSVVIRKTGGPIKIPKLKLMGFEAHTPPTRHYRVIKDKFIVVESIAP